MKHLKTIDVSEKLTWKEFILYVGLGYGAYKGGNEIRQINNLRNIYQQVLSSKSDPNREESQFCEDIRTNLLSQIEASPKFKKFGKREILDSIKNIKFKILDSDEIENTMQRSFHGALFNIGWYKKSFPNRSKILKVPDEDDVIIICRSSLNTPQISNVIYHELYHYLDKLYGDDNFSFSDKSNIDKFLDRRILSDKVYSEKKFLTLATITAKGKDYIPLLYGPDSLEILNKNKDYFLKTADDWVKDYLSRYDYLSSSKEVYARWKALKEDMIESGVIKYPDTKVTLDDIGKYLSIKKDITVNYTIYDLLMSLDLNKLDDLQKEID